MMYHNWESTMRMSVLVVELVLRMVARVDSRMGMVAEMLVWQCYSYCYCCCCYGMRIIFDRWEMRSVVVGV